MSTEFRGTEVLLARRIMATEIMTSLREETGLINETTGQQIEIELVTDLIGTVITGVARINDSALVWHIVLFFSVRENVHPPPHRGFYDQIPFPLEILVLLAFKTHFLLDVSKPLGEVDIDFFRNHRF